MSKVKELKRSRRHTRTRKKILANPTRPRLVVFRSLKNIYAQIIDDKTGKTLAQASGLKSKKKGTKTEKAVEVGKEIASKAKELKIESVSFDRNGYKYHGRVKALAEAAREGGLKI
ncbi:50S ribosomal protein L18 [Candidatus Peregrinibacteria bacterium]|nr:50S ribosomal protein L18 [Candidatus Peregrinibacteria bacterium]